MFHFLETDIREQIKYEMRTETSVDNNYLRYEIKFSRSTHLLMFLSLDTLMFIIRTGLPILVELINLVNSVSNDLTQMVNFPTQIPDLLFWINLFLLKLVFVLQ